MVKFYVFIIFLISLLNSCSFRNQKFSYLTNKGKFYAYGVWVDMSLYRITGIGKPVKGIKKLELAKKSAKEQAKINATFRAFKDFTGCELKIIKSSKQKKLNLPYAYKIAASIANSGTIKSIFWDKTNTCEIIYEISSTSNLKMKVARYFHNLCVGHHVYLNRKKVEFGEYNAYYKNRIKQNYINGFWVNDKTFRIIGRGIPRQFLKDPEQRQKSSLNNATRQAQMNAFSRLKKIPIISKKEWFQIQRKAKNKLLSIINSIKKGNIITVTYNNKQYCEIIFEIVFDHPIILDD